MFPLSKDVKETTQVNKQNNPEDDEMEAVSEEIFKDKNELSQVLGQLGLIGKAVENDFKYIEK